MAHEQGQQPFVLFGGAHEVGHLAGEFVEPLPARLDGQLCLRHTLYDKSTAPALKGPEFGICAITAHPVATNIVSRGSNNGSQLQTCACRAHYRNRA